MKKFLVLALLLAAFLLPSPARAACVLPEVTGQSGQDPATAPGFITSIVANGTNDLTITYTNGGVSTPAVVSLGASGGGVTGSWSGAKITSITITSGAPTVLQINGVNSLTFHSSLALGPVGTSSWSGATGGLKRIGFSSGFSAGSRNQIKFEGLHNGAVSSPSKFLSGGTCTATIAYAYANNFDDYVFTITAPDATTVDFVLNGSVYNTDNSPPFSYTRSFDDNKYTYSGAVTFPGGGKKYPFPPSPRTTQKPQIGNGGQSTNCMTYLGQMWCWGRGLYGALGNGGTADSASPVGISYHNSVEYIGMHRDGGCFLEEGDVYCWGKNTYGILGYDPATLSQSATPVYVTHPVGSSGYVFRLAVGEYHACALYDDGYVYCWGRGSSGQLGNSSTGATNYTMQGPIGSLSGFTQSIFAGGDTTCAIDFPGALYCWGRDDWGQVGNGGGAAGGIVSPAAVVGLGAGSGVYSVGVGYRHTCAMTFNAGTGNMGIKCWGNNQYAQLGLGIQDGGTHVSPQTATTWTANSLNGVFAGRNYNTCAYYNGTSIQCIGENTFGEMGNNTTGTTQAVPVSPTGLSTGVYRKNAGSGSGHMGVLANGEVHLWGDNTYGQLGDPGAGAVELTPNQCPSF